MRSLTKFIVTTELCQADWTIFASVQLRMMDACALLR